MTDAPSLEFNGLKLHVFRDGSRVTGHVEFPCLVGEDLDTAARKIRHGERITGRKECRIDYVVSDGSASSVSSADHPPPSLIATRRAALVSQWREACTMSPAETKVEVAKRIIAASNVQCSVRTLQLWSQKLDAGGPRALTPGYVSPPSLRGSVAPSLRKDALLLCAWWAFRIGNVPMIVTSMMASAVKALQDGYAIADLIATVDCYYAFDTDRSRYPFKPFAKWIRYDLAKWTLRAASNEDYRHAVRAGSRERVPLQIVDRTANTALVHGPATRKRRALDHKTRKDIAALSEPVCGTGVSPVEDSLAEFLIALPDDLRGMLLRACARDSKDGVAQARDEATATLPLWWDRLPAALRNFIDGAVTDWRAGRPNITDDAADKRRVQLLLPELRDPDLLRNVRVASRMPV